MPGPATPTEQTRRLYAGDWAHFVQWCRTGHHTALPASPATMAGYLQALAVRLRPGTLGRRRSAVAAMHRQHGLPVPNLDAAARAALRQDLHPTRNPAACSPTARPPAFARLAAGTPRTLAGLRDRALLLLAAATDGSAPPTEQGTTEQGTARQGTARQGTARQGTARQGTARQRTRVPRTFLLLLDVDHVTFTPGGVTLRLHTRTDAPPGRTLSLSRHQAPASCPVRTLEDWLRTSGTAFGPVFRKVDRWGNVEHARLGPGIWTRILRRHAG